MHLIVGLVLKVGVLTLSLFAPPPSTFLTIEVECENGFYSSSIHELSRSSHTHTIRGTMNGECEVLVRGVDEMGMEVKREVRTFFGPPPN